MYLIPNRLIFLATPRTASRSAAQFLRDNSGAVFSQVSVRHHATLLEAKCAKTLYSEPVVTFTRHPVMHVQSMINLYDEIQKSRSGLIRNRSEISVRTPETDFSRFFADDSPFWIPLMRAHKEPRLNVFAEFADHILLLENGLAHNFAAFGISPNDATEPEVGKLKTSHNGIVTDENIALVKKWFPYDWDVYQKALELNH